jgi:hypothetical protein
LKISGLEKNTVVAGALASECAGGKIGFLLGNLNLRLGVNTIFAADGRGVAAFGNQSILVRPRWDPRMPLGIAVRSPSWLLGWLGKRNQGQRLVAAWSPSVGPKGIYGGIVLPPENLRRTIVVTGIRDRRRVWEIRWGYAPALVAGIRKKLPGGAIGALGYAGVTVPGQGWVVSGSVRQPVYGVRETFSWKNLLWKIHAELEVRVSPPGPEQWRETKERGRFRVFRKVGRGSLEAGCTGGFPRWTLAFRHPLSGGDALFRVYLAAGSPAWSWRWRTPRIGLQYTSTLSHAHTWVTGAPGLPGSGRLLFQKKGTAALRVLYRFRGFGLQWWLQGTLARESRRAVLQHSAARRNYAFVLAVRVEHS